MVATLSDVQIAQYASAAGFRSSALVVAIAVALAESSGNPGETNKNRDGSVDRGLWQINSVHSRYDNNRLLSDPLYNARAAYDISKSGNDWSPWYSFDGPPPHNGSYRKFLARAQDAAAGTPVNGAPPPIDPGNGGSTTPDVLPPQAPELDFGYQPATTLDGITVEGLHPFVQGAFGESLFQAGMDLSWSEASELTIRFIDQGYQLVANNFIDVGVNVRLRDLDMRCKEFGTVDSDGLPAIEMVAASRAVEELKQLSLVNPPQGASPTSLLAEQCARVGLRFYGQGSPTGIEVKEVERDNGTKSKETLWEYASRRADEMGFKLFEAGGTVWFAKPSWLVARTTRIRVGVNNAWGDERLDAQGIPVCRSTATPDGVITTTVSLQLPRWIGEQVRPGMGLELKGVDPPHLTPRPDVGLRPDDSRAGIDKALDAVRGAFGSNVGPSGTGVAVGGTVNEIIRRVFPRSRGFDKLYVVTRVHGDVGGVNDPVTIDATEPTDPAAKGLGRALDIASGGAASSTFPGASAPGAMRISDWGVFEYCAAVGRYVRDTFGVTSIGGYRVDAYHEHDTRRCLDLMVGGDRAKGDAVKNFLLTLPQTKYCIWQQRIWYPGGHGDHDMADRGSATQNHRDHVHWLSN